MIAIYANAELSRQIRALERRARCLARMSNHAARRGDLYVLREINRRLDRVRCSLGIR